MSLSVISKEFHDFDQFRDVLLGWDVDVTQLSRGPLDLSSHQVSFDKAMTLSYLRSNRCITDKMAIDHGWITFVVCFSPNTYCGLQVPKGSMLIFGPGREYRSVLPEGFRSFEICASVDYLREGGLNIGDLKFDEMQPENSILSLSGYHMDEFVRLSRALRSLDDGQSKDTLWTAAARERAMGLLADVLKDYGRAKFHPVKPKRSGWLLALRAIDHLDCSRSHLESISDLSKSLGCSSRALQVAFQTNLGTTPLQYILARRLQRARCDLLDASPDQETVTNIAADHEFFHFGRFTQYYKNLFGELPSHTLKRTSKTRHQRR